MKVTPFGAKSPTSTVVGVAANADGNLVTAKKWENNVIRVCDEEVTGVESFQTDLIDVSDAAAVSLRFSNTSDQSFMITFYSDQYPNNTYQLYDYNGNKVQCKIIKSSSRTQILTPDDLPVLQWLKSIRMRVAFDAAPASGSLIIDLVAKR